MELKEKIELRRREREAEALAALDQQKLADAQAKTDAQAEQKRLTKLALTVLSDSEARTSSEQAAALSKEEAEKILDKAANEAVGVWLPLVIVGGLGFGIYIGFTQSWGMGSLLILGTLIGGSALFNAHAADKKAEMMEAHQAEKMVASRVLPQSPSDKTTLQ